LLQEGIQEEEREEFIAEHDVESMTIITSFSKLLEKIKVEEPTIIELTSIGSILHSFYPRAREDSHLLRW